MTRHYQGLTWPALILLGTLTLSCGDDDNPAAVDTPCDDANTTCVSLTLSDDDVAYTTTYYSASNQTVHSLAWDMSSKQVDDYGPGQRIIVNITFDPPLKVRYNHNNEDFGFSAGEKGTCTNRYASPSTWEFTHNGWTSSLDDINLSGECTTGESILFMRATFQDLLKDRELKHLSYDFVVPEAYTSGASAGEPVLPGDLVIWRIRISTYITGNNGGDPPIWPGTVVPISN